MYVYLYVIYMANLVKICLEYYLSDASGLPITKDGNIVLHNRDGSSETHVWTLTSWLNISGIRYQSRAKLFCVEKSTREVVYQLPKNSWVLNPSHFHNSGFKMLINVQTSKSTAATS